MANLGPERISPEQAHAIVQATTFDIFNEHDQAKRRHLMERFWAPDVTCCSPFGVATGYGALDHVWDGEYTILSYFNYCEPGISPFHVTYLLCVLLKI